MRMLPPRILQPLGLILAVFAGAVSTMVGQEHSKPVAVAEMLQPGKDPVNPAPGAIVFDGPPGRGRRLSKGILLKSPPPAAGLGSTWAFRLTRHPGVYAIQIIHPLGGGQLNIQLETKAIGLAMPTKWTDIGYKVMENPALQHTAAFAEIFPLKAESEYFVVSRLSTSGAYEMLIDGKLVATAFVKDVPAGPLSLEMPAGTRFWGFGDRYGEPSFKGQDLPLQWSAGWAALFAGPIDNGAPNTCRAIQYFTNYVDPELGTPVAIPSSTETSVAIAKTDSPRPASIVAPPAPTTTPVKPTLSAAPIEAADLVKTHRSNLVFVTMEGGSGSGFVASYGNGTYLITNAHVTAGAKGAVFKTLEGTQVAVGAPAVAVGHDIFLMALKPVANPLPVMTGVDEHAAIGDQVVVLGNAEGAGVINTIKGKIVGLGPNLVEVDAPFQPGNSGSPIIHLKTGKVIGVATYALIRKYDPATKEAVKEPIVRRFGYRLDSVKKWEPVNWQVFNAQAAGVESIEKLTEDLVGFLQDLSKDGRVNRGAHSNPVIKTRIDQWLDAKSRRLSARDNSNADQSFLSFLKVTCQSDIAAAMQRPAYDYFRRQLEDQQKERTEIANYFSKIIESIRQER